MNFIFSGKHSIYKDDCKLTRETQCSVETRRGECISLLSTPVSRGGRTEPGPGWWEQCRGWTAWAKPWVRIGAIFIQPWLNHERHKQYWRQQYCERVRTGLGTVANRWSSFHILSHTETGQIQEILVTTVCLLEIIWEKDGTGVGEFGEAVIKVQRDRRVLLL